MSTTRTSPRAIVAAPTAHLLRTLPEVKDIVRLAYYQSNEMYLDQGQTRVTLALETVWVDANFFQLFPFDFIYGDPSTALHATNSYILSEHSANTFFPGIDPTGKLMMDDLGRSVSITGVVKDVPNSHFSFDAMRPLESAPWDITARDASPIHVHYVLLKEDQNIKVIERKMTDLLIAHWSKDSKEKWGLPNIALRPLEEIYFEGNEAIERNYSQHGQFNQVVAYTMVALLSLLLASMNFINLYVAKSMSRIKEVSLKKISGMSSRMVFFQFLGEVSVITFLALILSIIFAHSLVPKFNSLMDSSLSLENAINPLNVLIALGSVLLISLLSGGVPALLMSSLKASQAITGTHFSHNKKMMLRKLGLTLQFSVSVLLLIGIFTVLRQIEFMKAKDLGFEKDHLLAFNFNIAEVDEQVLINTLLTNPNVLSASHAYRGVPGFNEMLGDPGWTAEYKDETIRFQFVVIDENYTNTMDLELLEGRIPDRQNFNDNEHFGTATPVKALINQTGYRTLGLDILSSPRVKYPQFEQEVEIIGVVKDFHINAVKELIHPMLLIFGDLGTWEHFPIVHSQMMVKVSSGKISETIPIIEDQVEQLAGAIPDIQLVDRNFEQQYGNDTNFAELLAYLTSVVMLVGSMGLLGIFMHVIQLHIKEIGIRKVLGATLPQIIQLLTGPLIRIIIISSFIAVPIGAIVMDNWLANYPYRIELDWTIFAIAIGSTLLIAALTIGWRCWQASNQNPARLIRYE